MNRRRRYAIVGTGGRSEMFIEAAVVQYRDQAELVALCDVSQVRMDYWNREIEGRFGATGVPTYHADDFDKMVRRQRPDVVVVTTIDCMHHHYIVRALELGCDAITEKPMTIDEVKAQAIFDAVARTGGHVTVCFNFRYTPEVTLVRRLIMEGRIGQPLAVDLTWMLDTSHGADYFRRWHREKDKSGGLLVHKATHHFDIVNFWVDSIPKTVFAMGDLKFYGRANARDRGELRDYERYTGVPEATNDPFRLDLTASESLKGLYYDAEAESGYIRDRNVFGDHITAEDTMGVLARYRNGVHLVYSLVAYSPWEGLRASVTGTRGRVELSDRYAMPIIAGPGLEDAAATTQADRNTVVKLYPMFDAPVELEVPLAAGGHGGGDSAILDQLFLPDPPPDDLHRSATHIDGAASILLGVAANRSIATGRPVEVDQLLALPASVEPVAGT